MRISGKQMTFDWNTVFDETFPNGDRPLQFFLSDDGTHRIVHAQHLLIPSHDLARAAGSAVVEQDEVFNQIKQPLFGEHALK